MQLNAMQEIAVSHKDGPCLVIAGPGSGKTKVLTHRVAELTKSGVPAEQILVITFTKAAAVEMKERFNGLGGEVPVTFATFHSLFWEILQRELGYKNSDIIQGQSRARIIKAALKNAKIEVDDIATFNMYASELSALYNNSSEDYDPKYIDKSNLLKLWCQYEKLKSKYRVIDFDDMLQKAYLLFKNNPVILEKWQGRFSYFLIDEMQDMNNIQFSLIRMLSAKTNNIFCVGDDDQSIYGFRGSSPTIMRDFVTVYPDAKKVFLNVNYRNPQNLVMSAASLLKHNNNRFKKSIEATVSDGAISVNAYSTPSKEAASIANKINSLLQQGTPTEEIVILYRNHSDARYLVNELINQKIPFYLKEQMPNIYSHPIIQDIECYFQIAIGNGTRARILRILNRPNRYLHRSSVETSGFKGMLSFYRDNRSGYKAVEALIADLKLISKMNPFAAINYIRNVVGYESYLKQEALEKGDDFLDSKHVLDFMSEVVKDCKTIKQAIDKLGLMRLKVDYDNQNRQSLRKGKVGLYTLHSSKGLEFENVFIIEVNEGIIPTNKVETVDDIEAERRLFYVGITRCKRNLYISYINKINRDKSRFISELKVDYSADSSS